MSERLTKVTCDWFDCVNNDGDYCRCPVIYLRQVFKDDMAEEVFNCSNYVQREVEYEPLLTREEVDNIGKRLEERKKANERTHSEKDRKPETEKP